MDLFSEKLVTPMLIGKEGAPFDDPSYIYELKLDGIRCLAYLCKNETDLRNKRNLRVSAIYPELSGIFEQVKESCVLDGEIIVMQEGRPDFSEIQRRSHMTDPFRIRLSARKLPVSFIAFDILYRKDKQVTHLSLMDRKSLLEKVLKQESDRLALSRFVEEQGKRLYLLAEHNQLEGIVAKQRHSLYYPGKRTKDWIKIKNLKDDDFVVCGYIEKTSGVVSVILGQYLGNELMYQGHVTLGISREDFQRIKNSRRISSHPFSQLPPGSGNDRAVFLDPHLVCTVKFMERTKSGGLRQPVWKGLREDKNPFECTSPRI